MRRTAIAAAWVFGATVPLLAAAVFLFGCCVLPFHGIVHRLMPLCQTAADIAAGGHAVDHDHHPSSPARQKEEPVKRLATELPFSAVTRVTATAARALPLDAVAYRSFITLGATRCDQDVGLTVIVGAFLI